MNGTVTRRRIFAQPQRSAIFAAISRRTEALVADSFHPKEDASFLLWGGLAAELLLGDVGIECMHFSLHDVEISLTKGGRLFSAPILTTALENQFLQDPEIALQIGGLPITAPKQGMSIVQFQDTRIRLMDGDLLLNNVALARSTSSSHWEFIVPEALAIELDQGLHMVEMKDTSDLVGSQKIGRRIYRNISKALRFQLAAKLEISDNLEFENMQLATKYLDCWKDTNDSQLHPRSLPDYNAIVQATCSANSRQEASEWLYSKTFCEVAMRTFGLQITDKPTLEDFQGIILGSKDHAPIASQSLMISLATRLEISREKSINLANNALPYAHLNYIKYLRIAT